MESYPWWTEEQKAFAKEVHDFATEVLPYEAETRWTREFPWKIHEEIAQRGYIGASIPKEYGGLGLGATGACIANEQFSRMPGVVRVSNGNQLGGVRQMIEFGNEKQKREFLPRMAKGEIGAIVMTETVAGTDVSPLRTSAGSDQDVYILNGKKRFITSAGVANRYMVYARTSDDSEDIRSHHHLTAFIVEKGTPGFSVEKMNEIAGFMNAQNGTLNFNNVEIPKDHRLGQEGMGWRIMMSGLNYERTLISAMVSGYIRELLRTVVPYTQRRIQFNRPTIDLPTNQFKIADLIIKWKLSRLITYYTAYLWDLGKEVTIESNVAKVFNCEAAMQECLSAIQLMGGDGVTPFYPLEEIMNVVKVENIAGGTTEACRVVLFRSGMKELAHEFRMQPREIHPNLGVPVPAKEPTLREKCVDQETLLGLLAEDYRVNPALYMSRADIMERCKIDNKELDRLLLALEKDGFATLYRSKKGIELAKATYEGLNHAHPLEYYQWFPEWIDKGRDRRF